MPSLEEIMGHEYRDDMTAEDVNAFFKNKVLSTGEYESKSKVDAERKASAQKIQDLQAKIQGNMTDEEVKAQELENLQKRIKELEENNKVSAIEKSKLKVDGTLAESRILMEIQTDDKAYQKFLDNISVEDTNKTEEIGKYINKLVKDAYEKGKSESTKKSLGNMGNQYSGGSIDGEISKDIDLVKKMQASKPKQKELKKSNFI